MRQELKHNDWRTHRGAWRRPMCGLSAKVPRIFAQVQRYALATLDAPKVVGVNPGPLTLREFAHGVASFFRPLGSNRWGQIAVYR